MPDPESLTIRVTVIAGQRHPDDFAVIWRGMTIGRIFPPVRRAVWHAAMVVELPYRRPAAAKR